MRRAAGRAVAGLGIVLGLGVTSWGQNFGPPQQGGGGAGSSLPTAAVGGQVGTGSAYTNPYANPMMNPYMNPYMSQYPANSGDALMYFMAAQQARAAGGAPAPGATMPVPGQVPAQGQRQPARPRSRGGPSQGLSARRVVPQAPATPAGRQQPSISRGYVAGRYSDFSQFNDSYGRLSSRYAAYGAVMTDDQTGGVAVPGLCPAPNQGAPGCFNRYPSYSQINRR